MTSYAVAICSCCCHKRVALCGLPASIDPLCNKAPNPEAAAPALAAASPLAPGVLGAGCQHHLLMQKQDFLGLHRSSSQAP